MVQGAQRCPCPFTEGLALSLSNRLGFRASGGLRGTDCRTGGPNTLLTYLSGELPHPLLMWTLASTLPLQPLPDLRHPAIQQGRQRTARLLTGKAYLGQMRKRISEPENSLLGPRGRGTVRPGKEGAGVCGGMKTVKAKKEVAQVWLQEQWGATQ